MRLTDDYRYESEEEKEEQQQTSKKEPLKKPTKDDVSNSNEWVNKKEANINNETFQRHFKFQRPSDILQLAYKANNKKKNSELVNIIKSGLSDLENEIENMSEEEKEIEKPSEIKDLLKKSSSLTNINKDRG